MKSNYIILLVCILFGFQSPIAAQSSDWVYSPYAQYLTNDTTIPTPVGEPADAALSCFRHDTIYVLVMPSGELYIWLRPDPLMDKYIQSSPYAYCHGNPLKYVDPDGRDDFFNELGEYLEHIDNGTDYVMVRRNNGEVQNLVSFSYSPDNVNNRNMLSNVASYYAQKVGLNQNIDVLDNPKGGESAMFATIARHVSMVVNNGSINSDANTSNNIMNALVHEYDHVKKGTSGAIAEIEAIAKGVTHQTWVNTTESYKQATMQYLVDNANAATRPVFTIIEPIISRLEAFGLILNYNQGANVYSWEILIPEFVITAPRRQ